MASNKMKLTTSSSTSGLSIQAGSPYIYTAQAVADDSCMQYYDTGNILSEAMQYLTEDELDTIISNICDRDGENQAANMFLVLLEHRHFSEKFIMKWGVGRFTSRVERYVFKNYLMKMHKSDVKTGVYSELALWLAMDENNK